LMNINADSVLREDSMRKAEAFKNAFSGATRVMVPGGAPMAANMVGFSPSTQYQANELNEGAWLIYTYTNDPSYLAKALAWAKRAVEFYASAPVMDTYARLLYKTGDKDTAISWEEKAVALSQSNKTPGKEFEEVLARMKSGAVSLEK
ncbi:MAG: hypothetical protein JWQ78_310, partial [Sediminibacterium sp.]|nr:hypothetical protein [Sediminibacterium sp.]